MSGVSGDFPVQLASCIPGGLLHCSAARLSVCRVVLQIPRARLVADKSPTSPYSILVVHVRHAQFPRDMLATSS